METEMTNELKAKFFAQYWGQKVLTSKNWETEGDPEYVCGPYFDGNYEGHYLLLKPLSSITDEDAIEVAKILYPGYKGEWQVCDKGAALLKLRNNKGSMLIIWKDLSGQYGVNDLDYYLLPNVVDYLRSKSYALPFMGISVNQLTTAQWVKLITTNSK